MHTCNLNFTMLFKIRWLIFEFDVDFPENVGAEFHIVYIV